MTNRYMKHFPSLLMLSTIFLLVACNPHPASGVWKAAADNDYGIDKLVMAFDGKAHFTTTKRDNAEWHCFWTTSSKTETELKCTPSTNPDQEELYTLTINNQGFAELKHNDKQVTSFIRLDDNPTPEK